MKLIKLKIYRTKKEGATHYEQPPNYKAESVKFGPVYEGGLTEVVQSDVLPRNADDEFILIGVADADFSQFMRDDGYEKNGFNQMTQPPLIPPSLTKRRGRGG